MAEAYSNMQTRALFFSDLFLNQEKDGKKDSDSVRSKKKADRLQLKLSHGLSESSSGRSSAKPPELRKSPLQKKESTFKKIEDNKELRLSGHQLLEVAPLTLNLDYMISPKFQTPQKEAMPQQDMEEDKITHGYSEQTKQQILFTESPRIEPTAPVKLVIQKPQKVNQNFMFEEDDSFISLGNHVSREKHQRDVSMSDIRPGSYIEENGAVRALDLFSNLCESATPNLLPRLKDIKLLALFAMEDIIKLMFTCKEFYRLLTQAVPAIKLLIQYGYMSPKLRIPFWEFTLLTPKQDKVNTFYRLQTHLLESCVLDQERPQKRDRIDLHSYYEEIVEIVESPPAWLNQTSEAKFLKKITEQISQQGNNLTLRDINRTFHTSRVTTPEGQRELKRLLMATAFSNFYIGYCQGMNFLAATILSIVKDETRAYLIFQGLLYEKDVYEIYYPRVPGLHLRDYQLEQLLVTHCPRLLSYLKRINMKPSYITSKWIMTLFTCYLKEELIPSLLDNFVRQGWKGFFKIALALIKRVERDVVGMEIHDTSSYFRDQSRNQNFSAKELLSEAVTIKLPQNVLDRLEEQYYMRLAEDKLIVSFRNFEVSEKCVPFNEYYEYIQTFDQASNKIEPDQTVALSFAKAELIKLEPITRQDIQKFQAKLQKCERELETELKQYAPFEQEFPILKSEYDALLESQSMYKQTLDQITKVLHSKKQKIKLDKFNFIHKNKFAYLASMSTANRNRQVTNEELVAEELQQEIEEAKRKNEEQKKSKLKPSVPLHVEVKMLEDDVAIINQKLSKTQMQRHTVETKLKNLKMKYSKNKVKVDELREKKKSIKDQLNGFLIMYELKKESIIKALSQNLRQCNMFKNYRLF